MTAPTNRTRPTAPAKCAACHRPLNSPLVCETCHRLYPADGLSHFELFGLAPTFDLDAQTLRQRYLELSRATHPDRHGAAAEPGVSVRVSAQLNEAYRVLADPVLRAEYLLEISGGPSAAEDKAVAPDVLDTALLLRERMAEAQAAGDAAALADCVARARAHYAAAAARSGELARRLPGDPAVRRELRATLNALRYFQRLLAEPQTP